LNELNCDNLPIYASFKRVCDVKDSLVKDMNNMMYGANDGTCSCKNTPNTSEVKSKVENDENSDEEEPLTQGYGFESLTNNYCSYLTGSHGQVRQKLVQCGCS